MVNKLRLGIIALIVLWASAVGVYSQAPSVLIDKVEINGKIVPYDGTEDIIIADTDSLYFSYKLSSMNSSSAMFQIKLFNNGDSSIKSGGVQSASYKGLAEGQYLISIGAFDMPGTWIAKSAMLKVIVNNRMRELIQRVDALSAKNSSDTLSEDAAAADSSGFGIWGILMGLAIGIVIAGIPLIIVSSKNRKNRGKKEMGANSDNINKEVHEKVVGENGSLKAEIAALRGQIDAMQARASEMKKRNRDLEESLNNLTSSKDELENLQKQKDDLFALIIHDIKNPAALIKSLVELLRSYDLTAVEQQEIIEDIAETTSKIVALSHEVSKILALETTQLNLDIQQWDLAATANEVVRRNMVHANKKEISFTFEAADNVPEVLFDVQKIEEVLDNLISNAIKFTMKGGKVRVKVYKEDSNVIAEVSDTGLGLSESDVQNAFRRGARLSAQPTGGESSTGLGLWIVKKLIEAHHGRVWVKSALGKGSIFAISLPINPPSDK